MTNDDGATTDCGGTDGILSTFDAFQEIPEMILLPIDIVNAENAEYYVE